MLTIPDCNRLGVILKMAQQTLLRFLNISLMNFHSRSIKSKYPQNILRKKKRIIFHLIRMPRIQIANLEKVLTLFKNIQVDMRQSKAGYVIIWTIVEPS